MIRRATILFAVCGCASKAAPASQPATPVAEQTSTSPREAEADADAGGTVEPVPPEPALPEPTELAAIAEQAVREVTSEHSSVLLTPALPLGWPPKPGEVVYVAYPIDPLPSGVIKWRIGRPIARVSVKLADKSASIEKLAVENTKPLGTFEDPLESAIDPILEAEATLFTIVAGQGDLEQARPLLRRYVDWIDAHPGLRADLREHAPGFLGWLAEK